MKQITTPISDDVIRDLKVGDAVALTGMMVTGRDTVHKWMIETFIKKTRAPQGDDLQVYEELKKILNGSLIYHCGPVVSGLDTKDYKFVAAGPTTSIREEPYQADVMKHFNIKGVIGKGGMGRKDPQRLCRKRPPFTSMPSAARLPTSPRPWSRCMASTRWNSASPKPSGSSRSRTSPSSSPWTRMAAVNMR